MKYYRLTKCINKNHNVNGYKGIAIGGALTYDSCKITSIRENVREYNERRRHVGVQVNWTFYGELQKNKDVLLLLEVCTEWRKNKLFYVIYR